MDRPLGHRTPPPPPVRTGPSGSLGPPGVHAALGLPGVGDPRGRSGEAGRVRARGVRSGEPVASGQSGSGRVGRGGGRFGRSPKPGSRGCVARRAIWVVVVLGVCGPGRQALRSRSVIKVIGSVRLCRSFTRVSSPFSKSKVNKSSS